MRLIDLNPRWVGHGGEGMNDKDGNPVPRRERVGVSYDCPCGKCGTRAFTPFTNPPDGGPGIGAVTWERTGEDFETLTVSPSIQRHAVNGYGCEWHGFIRNGEIINC